MQGNTDVAYCQAASEPVAYRLVSEINRLNLSFLTQATEIGFCRMQILWMKSFGCRRGLVM